VWGSQSDDGPIGSAVAEISAGGLTWGELRLHFHLHTSALESPLRFAKFLGQQIGLQLDRWSLQLRAGELKAQIERLQNIVDKRKALHRAKAIVANTRQISDAEALQFMRQLSETSGRGLHDVAEALIFGDAHKWTRDTRYAARKRGKRELATTQRRAD
jgi:Xaa-Pro aminopeptidase